MFENGFPREWSTIKKLALLFRSVINAVIPVLKTVTGNPIHILDALAKPAQSLSVKLEPMQAGSGDPSPDNVRPISGHTSADVTRTGVNMADPSVFDCTEPSYSTAVYWLGMTANADGTFTLTRPVGWGGTGFVYIGTYKAGTYEVSFDLIDDANVVCGAVFVAKRIGTWTTVASADWSGTLTEEGRAYKSITLPEDAEIWCAVGPWADNGASVISGNYQVSLTAAHDYAPYVGTTYPIPLGQTVYGGTLDVLTGVLTVDRAMVDLGGFTWTYDSAYTRFKSGYIADIMTKDSARKIEILSDMFISIFDGRPVASVPNNAIYTGAGERWVYIKTDLYTDADAFKSFVNGHIIVYPLATPQTIQLTPTQVELLQGENNLFSDGEMTLVYLADGNASDEEALNILLGGRYTNTHGADEPTDREALDIVLGGKK